jgi:hypothetical protein
MPGDASTRFKMRSDPYTTWTTFPRLSGLCL